jgi:hypothetical protein
MSERRLWGIFTDPNKKARIQVEKAVGLLGHTQEIVNGLREASNDVPPEKKVAFDEAISKMTSLAMDEICIITEDLPRPQSLKEFMRRMRLFFGLS